MARTLVLVSRNHRSRTRIWSRAAISVALALGSFALAWYAYFLDILATHQRPVDHTGIVTLVIAFVFMSWGLGGLWCVRIQRAFRRFGRRGLWFLASAPLIIIGPVWVFFSLVIMNW